MKLLDQKPRITEPTAAGVRRMCFKCPCGCGHCVGVRVAKYDAPGVWRITGGEFPHTLSLVPSIRVFVGPENCKGWHGYLTEGELREC